MSKFYPVVTIGFCLVLAICGCKSNLTSPTVTTQPAPGSRFIYIENASSSDRLGASIYDTSFTQLDLYTLTDTGILASGRYPVRIYSLLIPSTFTFPLITGYDSTGDFYLSATLWGWDTLPTATQRERVTPLSGQRSWGDTHTTTSSFLGLETLTLMQARSRLKNAWWFTLIRSLTTLIIRTIMNRGALILLPFGTRRR